MSNVYVDKPESRIKLEGLIRYHLNTCNKKEDDCICSVIARDNRKMI